MFMYDFVSLHVCMSLSSYIYVYMSVSVCKYVCLCVCMTGSICAYVCLCVCVYASVCLSVSSRACMCLSACACLCLPEHMPVCVCMSLSVCMCLPVCACACPCVPVYVAGCYGLLCMYISSAVLGGVGGCGTVTAEILADAQGQAVLGPLHYARVVEDHTGEDRSLPQHHRLVRRLLREPRRPHWWRERERERQSIVTHHEKL